MSGKDEATNGSRRYRSESGSDFKEPMHHRARGDYSGCVKVTPDGKEISLDKARYVRLGEAIRINKKYETVGLGVEAIAEVYNPDNDIEPDGRGGIFLYVLPRTQTIQASRRIQFIKPDLPKRPHRAAIPPATPTPSTYTKTPSLNLGDPLADLKSALGGGSRDETGLDILIGTDGGHHDTEIIGSEEIAAEAERLSDKKPGQKSGK